MIRARLLAAFAGHYVAWLFGRSAVPAAARAKSEAEHCADVDRLQQTVRSGRGLYRLVKRGAGHQARVQADLGGTSLDVRSFDAVVGIDEGARTALVEPQVTMRQLVERTGRCGLAPSVIPEFPEITVGGAIQGLGAESSSHRFGLFHESVEWMEVVLGDGSLLRLSPDDNADLWRALPGSYGSLAVLTLVCLKLQPRTATLEVKHLRAPAHDLLSAKLPFDDDFVDAIEVGDGEIILTTANACDEGPGEVGCYRPRWPGAYFCDHVMATAAQAVCETMTFEDYVFRYDRGAFWIAPTKLGRSLPSRLLFSGFATASNLYRLREAKRRLAPSPSSRLVQDCIVPADRAAEFLDCVRADMQGPLWLLPIRSSTGNLFGLRPGDWVNVGIYLRLDRPAAQVEACNRRLELALDRLGGRKTLHADLFMSRRDFAKTYDMDEYERVRRTYRADGAFPHIFDKLGIVDGC